MKVKSVNSVVLACAGAALLAAVAATASAASGKITVKASIAGSCTIAGLGDLNFGELDQSSSNAATATGTVLYWCTKDTPYTVALNNGENYDTGSDKRQMKQSGGAALLPYQLDIDKKSGIGNGPASNERLLLTGEILGADIRKGVAANYLDNVIVTFEP